LSLVLWSSMVRLSSLRSKNIGRMHVAAPPLLPPFLSQRRKSSQAPNGHHNEERSPPGDSQAPVLQVRWVSGTRAALPFPQRKVPLICTVRARVKWDGAFHRARIECGGQKKHATAGIRRDHMPETCIHRVYSTCSLKNSEKREAYSPGGTQDIWCASWRKLFKNVSACFVRLYCCKISMMPK